MTPILGIMASQISGHLTPPSSFYSIATITSSGTNLTFSSIPGTYKSLQIRGLGINNSGYSMACFLNGDGTAANYSDQTLAGNGTTAVANSSNAYFYNSFFQFSTTTSYPNVQIIDILDYTSTSKYKTIRTFAGTSANTTNTNNLEVSSVLWASTAAITSIVIGGATFQTGTTWALYGVN